jgi:hypothetical protein
VRGFVGTCWSCMHLPSGVLCALPRTLPASCYPDHLLPALPACLSLACLPALLRPCLCPMQAVRGGMAEGDLKEVVASTEVRVGGLMSGVDKRVNRFTNVGALFYVVHSAASVMLLLCGSDHAQTESWVQEECLPSGRDHVGPPAAAACCQTCLQIVPRVHHMYRLYCLYRRS